MSAFVFGLLLGAIFEWLGLFPQVRVGKNSNGNCVPLPPAPPPKPDITPKPRPVGGHLVIEGRLFGGYQPRPQQGTPNPPPSEP